MSAPANIETEFLLSHGEAERAIARAFESGTLHHSILITGAKGIGKATLGYRLARYIFSKQGGDMFEKLRLRAGEIKMKGFDEGEGAPRLAGGLAALDDSPMRIPKSAPIFSRFASGGIQDFKAVEREWADEEKLRRRPKITIDQVRRLRDFFSTTSAEGGHRVALVDAVDEMTTEAANALLKILEEPPEKSYLILVAHNPASVLPTIKSRCRIVRLGPIAPEHMDTLLEKYIPDSDAAQRERLKSLARGSIGAAIALYEGGATKLQDSLAAAIEGRETAAFIKAAAAEFEAFKAVALDFIESRARAAKAPEGLLDLRSEILRIFAAVGNANLDPGLVVFSVIDKMRRA